MKKIGVFGGSFDPIHTGHLIVAQDVHCALSLDEIIFIPACIPPHKKGRKLSRAEHRLKMIQCAIRSNPNFSSSDIELQRGGVSYTIDTIKELRRNSTPGTEFYFIVGSDNLPDIKTWKEPSELVKLCSLITIHRPGFKESAVPSDIKDLLTSVPVTAVDVSSREIRRRVRNGKPIRYLVPEEVEHYIHEVGIYRNTFSS